MNRFLLVAILCVGGCSSNGAAPGTSSGLAQAPEVTTTRKKTPKPVLTQAPTAPVAQLSWSVAASFPHDSSAFTQGLLWHNGVLYESTGLEGQSSLRKVDLQSGQVLQKVSLPNSVFAEGLALANNKLYQLSWRNKQGFIYDLGSFKRQGKFSYGNEGWGLTFDGTSLIHSDGSSTLAFRNPKNFALKRKVTVTRGGVPLTNLNELEYIDGKVWANVWQTDDIVVINPQTGVVESQLNMAGLLPAQERGGGEDVLNGIAYDAQNGRLFVTGKNWPKLFWIRLGNPQI